MLHAHALGHASSPALPRPAPACHRGAALSRGPLRCRAAAAEGAEGPQRHWLGLALSAAAAGLLLSGSPALAKGPRLPPIDRDPNRCERSNTIGQANAVADKTLDLRECKLSGRDLSSRVLSGALMLDADLSKAKLTEAVLTKAYAVNANFAGANLTSAVVDRVDFTKADLSKANFTNAVLTGVTWDEANLEGTIFQDALVGNEDAKRLCKNPTLKGNSRTEVGCRN